MSPLNGHVRSDRATMTRTRALRRTDNVSGETNVIKDCRYGYVNDNNERPEVESAVPSKESGGWKFFQVLE